MTHAALSRLLLTLPYDTEGGREALGPARETLEAARADFERRAPAVPQRDVGVERVREVETAFSRVAKALTRIGVELERGVSLEAVRVLDEALMALDDALTQFDQYEQGSPHPSPIPVVDRFILIGLNVRDGFVEPEVLRDMLELLTDTTSVLEADSARFRVLYGDPAADLADAFDEARRILESGATAAHVWSDSGNPDALLDALRLLRHGSVVLMERLGAMDAYVRAHARHSPVVALEELLRCAEGVRSDTLPLDFFAQTAAHVEGLIGFYDGNMRVARAFPLAFAIRDVLARADERTEFLLATAGPLMERVKSGPGALAYDITALESLKEALEACADAHLAVHQGIDGLLSSFASAPQVLDVVAAFGRVATGETTVEQANDRSSRFLAGCHALQDEMREQGDPGTFELRALLATQVQAIEQMQVYLMDRDESHLCQGVDILTAVVPRLGEMHREMRSKVDDQRRARERTILCFRCTTSNPIANRYCSKCNAMLPALPPEEETTFTDIVGGEPVTALPGNLHRLQTLFDTADAGGSLDEVADQLQKLLDELQNVARMFAERFVARPPQPVAAPHAAAFGQHLVSLMKAVADMIEGAHHGRIDWMAQALQSALDAGEAMQQAQYEMHLHASV